MQRNKTPIIYYTNLLIATVIQICTMMMMVSKSDDRKISNTTSLVFYCAVMANLYFKVCIALERYLSVFQCVYCLWALGFNVQHLYGHKYCVL